MRNESSSYTEADLAAFMTELEERERVALAERLEAGSARLEGLAGRLPAGGAEGGEHWNAHEVLAHIAVLSKFYGVLTYQIGTGRLTELDLLGQVGLRDVMGAQMAALPGRELVEMALSEQRRTSAYLRKANAADIRRRCEMRGGESLTAAEVARLPLCAHLELHLTQLEAALAGGN